MQNNNIEKFIESVKTIKCGTIASVYYESEEKTPKKVGLGVVTKRTAMRVQMRYSYQNAVNNRLERNDLERDFAADSLPWGAWVKGCENLLIEHKDNTYLRMYQFAKSEPKTLLFNSEGVLLSAEECEKFWAWKNGLSKGSAKQAEKGLDEGEQVKPFNPNVLNIISFSCGEINYVKEGFTMEYAV